MSRTFTFGRGMSLEKWLHQNHAEIIDGRDGCLLDNFLVATKRGLACILESYVNSNASCYRVTFSTAGDDTASNEWNAFCDNYDAD